MTYQSPENPAQESRGVFSSPLKTNPLLVLSVSFLVAMGMFSTSAMAQNNQDPAVNGCTNNSQTLTRTSGGNHLFGFRGWRGVVIDLKLSRKCKANWVRAYVPKGSSIYLKDDRGQTYVKYKTQVHGWNYSDMRNWNSPFQACARVPSGKEFCTSLID